VENLCINMGFRKAQASQAILGYLLILPAVGVVGATLFFPIVRALVTSFYDVDLIRRTVIFKGFANYVLLARSAEFWWAALRTAYFSIVSIAIELLLGYFIATLLNRPFKGRGIIRTIMILPWAVPTVVNGVIWKWIYNPNFGALNGLLYQLGFIDQYIPWLNNPFRAMNLVIIADVWKMTPFCALLLLAALQTIPRDIIEASRIDGAGTARIHLRIILPLLKPMILVILVVRTIDTFRVFDIIYVLTRGGPAGGTTVLGYLVYKEAFEFLRLGTGAAISVSITLLVAALGVLYYKWFYKPELG